MHVLRFLTDEVAITSLRFVRAGGIVNKRASDASLAQVTDAVLTEPFLGRLLGFGTLDVVTASTIGVQRLPMVRDAKGFKLALIEAKHELALQIARPTMPAIRMAGTPAPDAGGPAPDAGGPAPAPIPLPPMAPADVVAALRTAGRPARRRARSTRRGSTSGGATCSAGSESARSRRSGRYHTRDSTTRTLRTA